ncbi:MAG: hypothetical protein ACK417_04055 [Bacteroidia bacterium]
MKVFRNFALVLAAGMLVFTACKKDEIDPTDPNNPNNPNNPPAPTKAEILAEKPWKVKLTRMIEQGQNDTANINIVGADQWRFNFVADGTGTATGTFMATQQNPNPAFNWVFLNNDTQISITPTAGGNALIYDYKTETLERVIQNITLQLIDSNGNPVGNITGTLIEIFEKAN